ncbi:hypothetical protein MRB53_037651 [Persea americana]|nr:hypothetical protein MRB53_037651 [Persea americana]
MALYSRSSAASDKPTCCLSFSVRRPKALDNPMETLVSFLLRLTTCSSNSARFFDSLMRCETLHHLANGQTEGGVVWMILRRLLKQRLQNQTLTGEDALQLLQPLIRKIVVLQVLAVHLLHARHVIAESFAQECLPISFFVIRFGAQD